MAHGRRTSRVGLAQLVFLQVVSVESQHMILSDNLQEPEGRGFCVDVAGVISSSSVERGRLGDIVVQSCVAGCASWTLAPRCTSTTSSFRFEYDNGSIRAPFNFAISDMVLDDAYCWQARAAEPHRHLVAAKCNASEALQRFSWTPTGMLALRSWPSLCVAASEQTKDGSCFKSPTKVRSLSLETCNRVPWARKTWVSSTAKGEKKEQGSSLSTTASPGAGIDMLSTNETQDILSDRPGSKSASPNGSSVLSASAPVSHALEMVSIAFCFCVCGAAIFVRHLIAPKAGVPPPALPEENSMYIELDSELQALS